MKHLLFLLSLLAGLWGGQALAQFTTAPDLVTVSLVSEVKAAIPGKAFRVAVKLEHAPGAHTYGKELPADVIGRPTSLKWTLPEGWQVTDLAWPPTHQVPSTDGKTSEGYDGTVYLPATITPAGKAGESADVSVKANVLVCDDKSCTPKSLEAILKIRLADQVEPDPATAGVFTAASALVTASLVSEVQTAAPGQAFRVAVKLEHAPGAHTYGKELPPDIIGRPTSLKWSLPEGWRVIDLPWPPTHKVPSTDGKTSEGYNGTVYLPAAITPSGKAGESANVAVKASVLVCDDTSCTPKILDASLKVVLADRPEINAATAEVFGHAPAQRDAAMSAKASGAKADAGRSFAGYLVFAFIGGLILNVMPCVFPVLGIKVLGVVQQAGGNRREVVVHGLAYTIGILLCFWALGALVVSLGRTWGFQLQSPGFVFGLAVFFLVFALNMAGLFEIGASAVGVGADLQARHGYSGSFFSGLLATIVATPCSAPFLGTALGYAVTLPIAKALLMFTMIGIGLASPFLVLSAFPNLVSALPRPGAWMETFKQAMSFLLFGTVAFLAWILTGMIEGQPLLFMLLGLVAVALGCWVYGRWFLPHKSTRTRLTAVAAALTIGAAGVWAGWPQVEKGTPAGGSVTEGGLTWEAWSPERVADLRAAKTPVYIDYTAKWCLTCQVNKRVYKDPGVQKLLAEKKVVLLKADWTNEDERISKALADLGKAAVPVNVLYLPGKSEPVILPELLTVENVTAVFRQIP